MKLLAASLLLACATVSQAVVVFVCSYSINGVGTTVECAMEDNKSQVLHNSIDLPGSMHPWSMNQNGYSLSYSGDGAYGNKVYSLVAANGAAWSGHARNNLVTEGGSIDLSLTFFGNGVPALYNSESCYNTCMTLSGAMFSYCGKIEGLCYITQ